MDDMLFRRRNRNPGQSLLANDTSTYIDGQKEYDLAMIDHNRDYLKAIYREHPERRVYAPIGFFDDPPIET